MMNITLNPTLSGGTVTVLTPNGLSAGGKASYFTPDHTRLTPRVVDYLVTQVQPVQPTKKNPSPAPGVARSGAKITFIDRQTTEGCCDVQQGSVTWDLSGRWSLNQPEALVTSSLAYLRAVVNSQEFEDLMILGILPSQA